MLSNTWESYRRSWIRSLRAENKSPRTVETYTLALTQYAAWTDIGSPLDATTDDVREWLGTLHDSGKSPATVKQRYMSLRAFFQWLEVEDDVPSPMGKIRPPKVTEKPPPVLAPAQLEAVLATASTKSFRDRRDAAILHLLADTGVRASELVGLTVDDIDLDADVILVHGKGDKHRAAPFGYTSGQAVDRYLRVRASHKDARRTDALWLGERGPMTRAGLRHLVKARGDQAGVEGLHPHLFRHSFVHHWLASGGQEGDVARILGWTRKSAASMLDRYGASAATERAHSAHRSFGPVDKL